MRPSLGVSGSELWLLAREAYNPLVLNFLEYSGPKED
jgi:hypothetical protein